MKKSLIIFVLALCSAIFIQGQNKNFSDIEVKYHFKLIPDSLDRENHLKAEMILLCNKNQSYYFNPDMVKTYELINKQTQTFTNVQDIANNYVPIPKIRHNAWRENQTTTITSPLGKYNYSYEADEIKWKLLPETKKIEGFSTHLATTNIEGVTFYAWYTTEIPFSEGPFKFKGLPGLIIELYNENKTIEIHATSVETKSVEITKMNEPLNVNLRTRKGFLTAREKYLTHPFQSNSPKEVVQRKLEQLKKINTFLD
ncbi:MAG: GLPGLI family protein [Cruoricaptor ignavus]|nr:GLPGLI family protein [Cruoricaptor ignavus]